MTCQLLLMVGFSRAPALPGCPPVPSRCRQADRIQTPGLPPHPAFLLPPHVPVVLSLISWPHPHPWPSIANFSLSCFLLTFSSHIASGTCVKLLPVWWGCLYLLHILPGLPTPHTALAPLSNHLSPGPETLVLKADFVRAPTSKVSAGL